MVRKSLPHKIMSGAAVGVSPAETQSRVERLYNNGGGQQRYSTPGAYEVWYNSRRGRRTRRRGLRTPRGYLS